MYSERDYARLNLEASDFVKTLEFDRESIRFTCFKYRSPEEDNRESYDAQRGAVAQWIWYTPNNKHCLYVNLPGMQSGKVFRGEAFDTGTERVFPAQDAKTITDTKAMIRAGLEKLKELIEAEGQ